MIDFDIIKKKLSRLYLTENNLLKNPLQSLKASVHKYYAVNVGSQCYNYHLWHQWYFYGTNMYKAERFPTCPAWFHNIVGSSA